MVEWQVISRKIFWKCKHLARKRFGTARDIGHELSHLKGTGFNALNAGDYSRAIDYLRQAHSLVPTSGEVIGMLGCLYAIINRPECREELVTKVLDLPKGQLDDVIKIGKWLKPSDNIPATGDVIEGAAYKGFKMFAEEVILRVAEINPAKLLEIGHAAFHMNVLTIAQSALTKFIQTNPNNHNAWAMLVDAQQALCDLDSYEEFREMVLGRAKVALETDGRVLIDPYNLFAFGVDYRFLVEASVVRSREIEASTPAPVKPIYREPKAAGGKLRIGFLIYGSWYTSCKLCVGSIIANIDRNDFEVYGYCAHSTPDHPDFEHEFRAKFDHYKDVPFDNPAKAAQMIADDGIDILLDTTGHTRINCMDILTYRPAPLQVHYSGYGLSPGADYIDYLVSDENTHPPHCQHHDLQNYAMLRNTRWVYPPSKIDTRPETRRDAKLPEEGFLFTSFCHIGKIEPQAFDSWMEILKDVPGAKMVLCHWNIAEAVNNLRRRAGVMGVDPDRLYFVPPINHSEHLRRLQLLDLALDTYYLGGGVTTQDYVWAGLPMLSVSPPMENLHGTSGGLIPMGLGDTICPSFKALHERAVELALSPEKLSTLRMKFLEARETAAMFYPDIHARDLSDLLSLIWSMHENGDHASVRCL